MKRNIVRSFALVLWLLLVSGPVFAHHGLSAYDEKNQITLKGTVTEFEWTNPHCQIYVDVKDDKGNIVHWSFESLAPSRASRAGWNKNTLKPGDEVTLTVIRAKSGAPVGYIRKIELANGTELGMAPHD